MADTALDFSSRATIPETVGVHAAQPMEPVGAPRTACGFTIYQRSWYVSREAEVTCYRCRTTKPPTPEES